MKIVLSMPGDNQSEQYIINAIQDEGHEVVHIDHRTYAEAASKQLPKIMQFFRPDIFLCLYLVDGQTYPIDYIQNLKTHFPDVQYCAWIFDITINGVYAYNSPKFIELIKNYDYLFTVAKGHVEKFKKKGVNAFWVPEGYSTYAHYLPVLSKRELKDKPDVSFMGQFGHKEVHSERLKYLEAIASIGIDLQIFGNSHSAMTQKVEACYMHRPTHNDVEHSNIVANSKINLCHSGWQDTDGYVSARNYRVSAAGGFMLCNDGVGVRSLWEVDEEVVVYDSIKDCLNKIRHYLKEEDLRKAIAKKGQEKTLKNYEFRNSIKKIIEIV